MIRQGCVSLLLLLVAAPPVRAANTCASPGMPAGCVEVWPKKSATGQAYDAKHGVYFFTGLSGADHYFLLMGDLECDKTCTVFSLPDGSPAVDATTTFDLNGHTVRHSAAAYESISNNSFELWSGNQPTDWKVVAGSVEPRSTKDWQPMSGKLVLYSAGAVTLESAPVSLPAARAYHGYVTIGRAAESDIKLEVLDAAGTTRCAVTKPGFFRGQSIACRFDSTGPDSYRLRLTTKGYAYFDRSGIVPLGDHGVAVPTSWSLSASNSNHLPLVENLAGLQIPGSGDHANPQHYNRLEVKNGRIEAAHENQQSYGVYTSGTTRVMLHDLTIIAEGLKSHTVSAHGEIHHNTLIAHMPWYFARENSEEENVILHGGEFHDNVAVGGQGVIRLGGTGTKIYNNYLRNNAQATNHYAIIHSGAVSPEIHHNIFHPIEGSGILTYVGHGYRIHNNVFYVETAPCNVEYIDEDYSTNGIRMNDYGAKTNYDNQVHDNVFKITGSYSKTQWPNCMPITTGIFYSASGPDNRVYDNTFRITRTSSSEMAPCFGLYMGGAANNPPTNPLFTGNVFVTNDKAAWLASPYGEAKSMWRQDNHFVRLPNTFYGPTAPAAALRLGYYKGVATGTVLRNNHFSGGFDADAYSFTASSTSASYDITKSWHLTVRVLDAAGKPASGATVQASATGGKTTSATTNGAGLAQLVLVEYVESGNLTASATHARTLSSPYTVSVQHQGSTRSAGAVTMDRERFLSVSFGSTAGVTCQDGVIEGSEECDTSNLGTSSCASLGFDGGKLACSAACKLVTTGCFHDPVVSFSAAAPGGTVTFDLAVSDPDATAVSCVVAYGDGDQIALVGAPPYPLKKQLGHGYKGARTYHAHVSCTNARGGQSSRSLTIEVSSSGVVPGDAGPQPALDGGTVWPDGSSMGTEGGIAGKDAGVGLDNTASGADERGAANTLQGQGCSQGPASGAGWGVLALLGLLWLRRRAPCDHRR